MELEHTLTTDPLQTEMQAASEALRRGERERARDLFEAIVSRHPTHHEAMFMHATASAELGDMAGAEAALRRALELAPDHPEYLQLLSRALRLQRRTIEAAEVIEHLIQTAAATAAMHVELGNIRLLARQPIPAEAAFRKAVEIEPTSESAGSGLVLALAGQERHDDSVAEARMFVGRCPASAEAHARLAMLLERLDRLDEARPAADRAVSLDPAHRLALLALGTIQFRMSDFEPARATLERALDRATDPHDRQSIARTLAHTLDRLGKIDEAFARFTEAKPAAANQLPAVRQMADEFVRFLGASNRDLDAWSVASWGPAPPYLAFSTPPIFVVGFPRSGTTLLGRMLLSHGRFVTTDEHPAMGKLREHLQRHAGGIESVPKYLGQIGEPEIRLLRAMYFGEVERNLCGQNPAGKRLVDRHPINIAHLSIVRRLFPDAPVIACIRDPRDAVLSAFMRPARHPTAGSHFATLESSAEYYAALMGLWLHYREVLGLPWMEVKYEELVTQPEAQSRRALQFLSEPWNPASPPSPGSQQVSQGLHTHSIGRWRRYRAHFGAALGTLRPFVGAFGYNAD